MSPPGLEMRHDHPKLRLARTDRAVKDPLALQTVRTPVMPEWYEVHAALTRKTAAQREPGVPPRSGNVERRDGESQAPRPPQLLEPDDVRAEAGKELGEPLLPPDPVTAHGPGQAPQVRREDADFHALSLPGVFDASHAPNACYPRPDDRPQRPLAMVRMRAALRAGSIDAAPPSSRLGGAGVTLHRGAVSAPSRRSYP
jgi:hypothetical protein